MMVARAVAVRAETAPATGPCTGGSLSLIARLRRQPGPARTDTPTGSDTSATAPAAPAGERDAAAVGPDSAGPESAERVSAEQGAGEQPPAGPPGTGAGAAEPPRRGPVRRVLAVVLTTLAVLLVLLALVAPDV